MNLYLPKQLHSLLQIHSRESYFSSALYLLLLFILFSIPHLTLAQENEDLRFLIFEPVLIESSQDNDQLFVNELTSLPSSGRPVTASEYIFSRILVGNVLPDDSLNEPVIAYENSIRELELQGGAYEPALSQEYLSLGLVYQSQNNHVLALDYLEKALHINRVNLGLFNLEQEQIIEKKIQSHIALGELQNADQQQEYLFYLKSKYYGDNSVDLLPALNTFAEWNIFVFDSHLILNPALRSAVQSGSFINNTGRSFQDEDGFRISRLVNAQFLYRQIIQILLNNFGDSDPRLPEMERNLALTNYFFATNLDSINAFNNSSNPNQQLNSFQGFYQSSRVSASSLGFKHGREALERRLSYMYTYENITPQEIAKASIELGDWLMIFKKRAEALEIYKSTYDALVALEVSQDITVGLFNPVYPATIPTFIDYRYSRDLHNLPEFQALDYQGWFDVKLKINRFGQPQLLEIFNKSSEATEQIEDRLTRHLRNSMAFRPRIKDGELVDEELIEVRYYYTY